MLAEELQRVHSMSATSVVASFLASARRSTIAPSHSMGTTQLLHTLFMEDWASNMLPICLSCATLTFIWT